MTLAELVSPSLGYAFGNDARAMSEDEILQWQVSQQQAMAQAHWPLWYSQGQAQYEPPQMPLDERFADFKVRLAAAVERHRRVSVRAIPS